MPDDFAAAVTQWYVGHARSLPWREPGSSPWAVLVSEVMLQQTAVARVLPLWSQWLRRWPEPSALAAEPVGEAVRAWGRLGYPRRALRLHAAAVAVCAHYGGVVPVDPAVLRRLPGIGDYTAAAVAAFAAGARVAVLDTNVRRVYARVFEGRADARAAGPTVAERHAALRRVPDPPGDYSVAVMELGALVCTARSPRCGDCPVSPSCRWLAAGRPQAAEPRRGQSYAGTDREVRGRLLAVLRDADDPVTAVTLETCWPEVEQRERALRSLVADGLAITAGPGRYQLP
jgi:A/G-specific adenine glycosylase